MAIPSCEEKDFLLTNLICNPLGYHFETPIDAEYESTGESKYVDIPNYDNGEIRLIMKNAEYSTDLPTVFYEVEYSNTQENNSTEV